MRSCWVTTPGLQRGTVKTTGKLLQVPVGKALLGRVVNAIGRRWMEKAKSRQTRFIRMIAPGVIKRVSVSQPVQTGIMAIDAMIPIGRGQRELIIGTAQLGKPQSQSTPSSVRRGSIKPVKREN